MQESRPDGLVFLLMALCCAGPILLAIGVPLLGGFILDEGIPLLVGIGLMLGGYLVWRRRKRKDCCPGETDERD